MAIVKDWEDPKKKINTSTCKYCTGDSAVRNPDGSLMTSKEWCTEVETCAATIDWDKVYDGIARTQGY
jgi:hypothetical protein